MSDPFLKAFAKSSVLICSLPSIDFENPLIIWDNITPELPLAPIKEPFDKDFPISVILSFSTLANSFIA